jgi:hypothetical protein
MQYQRQALVLGDLENIADAMITKENAGRIRALRFSEFEELLNNAADSSSLHELVELFKGFSPKRKPVLARILHAQACLGPVILTAYHRAPAADDLAQWLQQILQSPEFARMLSWTAGGGDPHTLDPAPEYVSERLRRLKNAYSWM